MASENTLRTKSRRAVVTTFATVVLLLFPLAGLAAPRQDTVRYETINPGLGAPPPDVVRSSPAAAWRSFLALASAGKFDQAAHLLDLSGTAPGAQKTVGA